VKITRAKLLGWDACYTVASIAKLIPESGLLLADVLRLSTIPFSDRIWVFCHAARKKIRMIWLSNIVERAIARSHKSDSRSVAVVAALRSNHVTQEIMDAAHGALTDARGAWSSELVSREAARNAWYAALVAWKATKSSWMGAWAASRDAELLEQYAEGDIQLTDAIDLCDGGVGGAR
jgi:hypothetical protein